MGRLAKNIYQYLPEAKLGRKVVGDKFYDSVHPLGSSMVHAYDAKIDAEHALKDAQANPEKDVIPMPDEDELAIARRRRNARMRGGRDSTVLAQDDGFGG
jgi:hypothetical protein